MDLDRSRSIATPPEIRSTLAPLLRRRLRVLIGCLALLLPMALQAQAQLALPHTAPSTPIAAGVDAVFTLDLGTLSQRPVLEVEVIPGAAHPDIELEIEMTNFQNFEGPTALPDDDVCAPRGPYGVELGVPFTPATSFFSDPATGTQTFAFDLAPCFPDASVYAGATVDIRVRALAFGTGDSPANVDITILSRTAPPFNEFFAISTGPRDLVIETGFKDTTIYEDNTSASNGKGEFLWAGNEVTLIPPWTFVREERRALLAVDLTNLFPPGSTINDAELVLEATGVLGAGGDVTLHEVDLNPINPWIEGNVDAAGDEFDGANQSPAANWIYRRATTRAWNTPGGDFDPTPLASATIWSPGTFGLSSPALAAVIADMIATDEDEDGFLLKGPGDAAQEDSAVQFGSSQSTTAPPQLVVTYTPPNGSVEDEFLAGTLSFIDEGEDLRWVYDLNFDNVLETQVGGVCEVDISGGDLDILLPYTYDYTGDPTFTGYDCCMWQITSNQSQVVGTGQAIFFHNLDPNDPANEPPDTDGDGIRDVCDNCPFLANGPALGTCLAGTAIGAHCINDGQCGTGGLCDLSQTDTDLDQIGNACPEPGFAVALGCGLLGVSAAGRRRARRDE